MASQSFDAKNVADVAVPFMLVGQDKKTVQYMAPSSNLSEPLRARISLDIKPVGVDGQDRRTVAFSKTRVNATTGKVGTDTISVMITTDRRVVPDAAGIADLWAETKSYLDLGTGLTLLVDGIAK